MEFPNKEDNTGTTFSQEVNPNSSVVNVGNDGVDEVITENIPSSNDILSEVNSTDNEHSSVIICKNDNEVNVETVISATEPAIENLETNKNSGVEVSEGSELVSEFTRVTETYQEYVPVSANEEGGNRSNDYVSEYVLEHQTENVYIAEVPDVNLDSSGEVNSKEVLSNDIDKQKNEFDKVDQLNTIATTELNKTEINETNFISEDSVADQGNENWSHLEQSNDNQLDTDEVKNEYANSNAEGNIDNVILIENVDGNKNKKTLLENEIPVESKVCENVEGAKASEDRYAYVKEETRPMEVDGDSTNKNQDECCINEAVSEAMVQEQVISMNDEIEEHVDLTNESAVSSEDISVEGYTIAEGMEVTEIQEGEYTIVEGPSSLDISTNQLESGNSNEEWVLLQNHENSEDNELETVADKQNEMYLSELRNEAESRQSVTSQSSENKPRRGRKPTYDLPMHVLGHDISKPMETVPNGRALPRPRLGVKVPYRNLTSQIVTKAEIEKEVMERARLKQEQTNSRADILFARKLTQRLARKIAPSPDPPRKLAETKKTKGSSTQIQSRETESASEERIEAENNQSEDNSKIHNDSDLLAILEGEGEEMPVLPKEVPQPQIDDSNLKMLEREIALQQLQDLPHQTAKHRIYRGRLIKTDGKAPVLTPEASLASKSKTSEQSDGIREPSASNQEQRNDQSVNIMSDKENETSRRHQSTSPRKDHSSIELSPPKKQPIEIEPQVKVNMVLKTYSRKRKTIELPEALAQPPLPKKPMLAEGEIKVEKLDSAISTDVYVTKSSRVIKRKVIWDPDEIPTRSPKSTIKIDIQSPKTTTSKTTKPVEKVPNSEKVPEKKTVSEKSTKEKLEKKSSEKISNKKVITPTEKRHIVSKNDASKSKTPIKGKKLRSEVDKLLMDEGAVKMLYDLKNNDELPKKKKDVYSVEKAHKEIIKKANEIKSDLEQNTSNESPKSLRKKDAFTPSPTKPAQITYNTERKMSKDSTRSSVHTPPGSPAYTFPHSQSSMLVRRRSSSSISSSDEVDENEVSKNSRKKTSSTLSDGSKSKKIKKTESNEPSEILSEVTHPPEKSIAMENKSFSYKSFTVKKTNKHATLDLNYINEKSYCSVQVLEELTSALKKFAKEKDCHVVSITSSSEAFCLGLDYTFLISDKEDVRKENATELAERVREFLLCLLRFPKVLIAGIQGDCVGLGVTMLPLFDIVIASDAATFSTPYASLGCVAEAGFLLAPPTFTNHGLAAELLYSTHKLTADDAFRRGLVTKLCWPEKYNETLKTIVNSVSKGSKQSLMATKKQLRRHLVHTTEAAINSESKLLVEHWISSECQKNFTQIRGNKVE